MAFVSGRCTNIELCTAAVTNRIVTLSDDLPFECPACGEPLAWLNTAAIAKKTSLRSILQLGALAVIVGVFAWKATTLGNLNVPTPVIPAAGVVAAPGAVAARPVIVARAAPPPVTSAPPAAASVPAAVPPSPDIAPPVDQTSPAPAALPGPAEDSDPVQRFRTLTKNAEKTQFVFRFAENTSALDDRAAQTALALDHYVKTRQISPARIILAGFSDPSGSPAVNLALSQARTASVASALQKLGIPPGHTAAFGAAMPVRDSRTMWGREQNRRVEVYVAPGN
jgi:outer membrane protein OmpA-like peptidoglycan-associated protein